MDPGLTWTLIIFFILLALGIPVAFVLGISSVLYFVFTGNYQAIRMIAQRTFEGMDSFVLMAIPLFLMAGEIMNRGGITDRLVAFAEIIVGRVRGGLAYVNILASMLFAGITGSALSDVAAIGSMLIPTMDKSGFDEDFSAAVTAASAIQGPIIPPSIPAVLVAGATGISVGALFVGGAIPGFLLAVGASIVVFKRSRSRNYPKRETRYSKSEIAKIVRDSILGLITPVIILGGIIGGVFTPTEAAGMAVLYSLILTMAIYRSLKIRGFIKILQNVVIGTSKIYFIIGLATAFAWILSIEGVPRMLTGYLDNIGAGYFLTLLLMNLLLLFWGMWMDTAPSIMILAPILFPIAEGVGVSPIHFGVIMVVNLMIGQISPPFGMTLFSTLTVSSITLKELVSELIPFLIFHIIVLGLVTYLPQISLWIPRITGLL